MGWRNGRRNPNRVKGNMLTSEQVFEAYETLYGGGCNDSATAAPIIAAAKGWDVKEVFDILLADELAQFIDCHKPVERTEGVA